MKTSTNLKLSGMFTLYIKQCLLFKSHDRIHKVMGFFGWLSIVTFSYAMIQLYLLSQAIAQY